MKIIPLSEGSFTVDASKKFIPFDHARDNMNERPAGSLLVEVQPFAIITSKDILVLDTGLGFTQPDGTLQIHANLINAGINPLDVTKVLMSHLHKDHAGGISKEDAVLQQRFLSFPNATYIVNKQELEIAVSKLSKSYQIDDVSMLTESNNVQLVESRGIIDDYIVYEWTGAHSPWHQAFWIRENNQTIFYGGDVAPQLFQMKTKFVTKYDFDGKLAADTRVKWWKQGEEEGWTFLFYHDIKTPIFTP
ncbi:MAG: MBL fold metallo-hydrolase [Chitinophagaceae bacterium]|jgi:glyoxylase-like metal-dependent hydrolase (beta-lactamase superfamily II)|nr:MBL fold metallo-hydrolase [Chitinophagaceae bacterium]